MSVLGTARRDAQRADEPSVPESLQSRLAAVRGRHILLVEDNEINQMVARELLEDAGLVVDVACDGQAALEMVRGAAYDLVFMDMQMPVMDGLTATREIRKIRGLSRLPIVAMTANAMEQDRQKCIEAGMNDSVIKPIDPERLWAALLQWVDQDGEAKRSAASSAPMEAPPSPPPGEPAVPVGIAGLDTTLGLARMAGKRPLYLAMLRRYVDGQATVCAQIQHALATGEISTAERIAHTTKGVSGSVGATEMESLAGALEQALRSYAPPVEVQRRLTELEVPLARLIASLELHLSPAAATGMPLH
jgi:two-component system sensor histidine kinase/response regulator